MERSLSTLNAVVGFFLGWRCFARWGGGNFRFNSVLLVVVLAGGVLASPAAMAGSCGWLGFTGAVTIDDFQFVLAGKKFMANKNWIEDPRTPLPIGTLMGSMEHSITFSICGGLADLNGQNVYLVYEPPANASPWGAGYRIPTTNPAVAMDLEFPTGIPYPAQPGRIILSRSANTVNHLGALGGFPGYPVKLTMVKTGYFSNSSITIDGPKDMGVFKYYGVQDGREATFRQRLSMPLNYGMGSKPGDSLGRAYTPYCNFYREGGYNFSVITLKPVNTSAFRGVGPADHPAQAEVFGFLCRGTSTTQPVIYFEATYPLGDGSAGVGMETPTSDVGVQLLLNDVPVRLGPAFAQHLPTDMTLVPSIHMGAGVYASPDGSFCLPSSNCSSDMTTNWFQNAAAWERGPIHAPVTLKYYQTTTSKPKPGTLSVPFSVTVDVQ